MIVLRDVIRGLLREQQKEKEAIGQCYPFATRMAIDAADDEFRDLSKFKVVHGMVTNKWSGEVTQHAWVEKGDVVFDWQTHKTKPEGIPKEVFYDHYQPSDMTYYTAEQTMTTCARRGHHGPWTSEGRLREQQKEKRT